MKKLILIMLVGLVTFAFSTSTADVQPIPEEEVPEVEIIPGQWISWPGGDAECLKNTCPCYVIIIFSSVDKVVNGPITTYYNCDVEEYRSSGVVSSSHDEAIVETGSFSGPGGTESTARVTYVN